MPRPLTSDRSFELETFWWPPDAALTPPSEATSGEHDEHPHDRPAVHGTLRYSPDSGAELTVFDLHGGSAPSLERPARVPILYGETLAGKPCTLFDALPVQDEQTGHRRLVLRAHQLLVGEHLPPTDEVRSRHFSVRLRGLHEWLIAPFNVTGEHVLPGLSREATPEGLSARLEGPQLGLGFDWRERAGEVVEEHATATFTFEEDIGLERFFSDWLLPLQDLLMLATREQSVLQSLVVRRYDERRYERINPAIRVAAPAETWNRWDVQVVRTPNVPLARPRASQFEKLLLPAAAIVEDLESVLRRWYALRWRLREAGAYFFASLNQEMPSLNRRLLDCMSFAEAYHQINGLGAPPLPKKEHRRLRDSALEGLGDHPHRERYRRALDDANRPDNAERIAELFSRARELAVGVDLQEQTLPSSLVGTRNYLTHWGDKPRKVLDGVARLHGLRRLTLVLQANLLLDLGLSAETVRTCVRESYRNAVWEEQG